LCSTPQTGENRRHNEPGTADTNVFRHIKEQSFAAVTGVEHGTAKPGRNAFIIASLSGYPA